MKENSTLLFIVNDFTNNNYLVDIRDLFNVFSSDKISDEFKKLECTPPDRLIKGILSKAY